MKPDHLATKRKSPCIAAWLGCMVMFAWTCQAAQASPTDADFRDCHRLASQELQACWDRQPGPAADEACWARALLAKRACYDQHQMPDRTDAQARQAAERKAARDAAASGKPP